MQITVRPITLSESPSISKLFTRALAEDFSYFPGEYVDGLAKQHSPLRFVRAGLNKNRLLLGLYDHSKLIGYSISDYSQRTDADIFWLYINPDYRSQGYGLVLLKATLLRLSDAGVAHVYLLTHQQVEFYKQCGFEQLDARDDLFEDITMYELGRDLSAKI